MSANEGAAALRRILPSRPVDLDHAYTLQDHGCGSGDCWQATLIGWTPASASCVRNLRLGMVDTGVDDHLQALAGARISSRRFLDATSGMRRSKDIAHGTAVAALLVGQDGSGLLPGSELLVADVFGKTDGGPRTGAIEIARGLDWLAGEGVTVVNLSLAGPANAALAAAVEHARKQGMSIVAAAGNAGPLAPPAYPAAYPGVVAATAVGRDFTLYSMANHGDYVAFAAPGVDLETADPAKGHLRRSGTSFAAAFVTAAVALARGQAPEKTADEIEALLAAEALDLGDPGRDSAYGWGLLRTEPGCAGG